MNSITTNSNPNLNPNPDSNFNPKDNVYIYAAFFVLYEVSVYLANDMIMPGMVKVVKEFHAPVSYAATSLTLFILGGCTLPLFLSALTIRIGNRKVLLLGNALFLVATIFIALTQNIHQFLLARLVQGMGLGFIFIGYSTVHQLFDDVAAIKLIALLGNISIMAPLIGPLIGGAITNTYDWRMVFVAVGILGAISYYGIYKYMPKEHLKREGYTTRHAFKTYFHILQNKYFLLGALISGLNGIAIIDWIGLSPVILFDTYRLPFSRYATYQVIVFSGYAISSFLLRYITQYIRAFNLIKFGSILAIVGLIISFIFSFGLFTLSVFGLFLFTLGAGLYTGIINRLTISQLREDTSATSALLSISNALANCIGLEFSNFVCAKISYSLPTLMMFNALIGFVCFSLTQYYAQSVKAHEWQ